MRLRRNLRVFPEGIAILLIPTDLKFVGWSPVHALFTGQDWIFAIPIRYLDGPEKF